jgi:hypothetical protein
MGKLRCVLFNWYVFLYNDRILNLSSHSYYHFLFKKHGDSFVIIIFWNIFSWRWKKECNSNGTNFVFSHLKRHLRILNSIFLVPNGISCDQIEYIVEDFILYISSLNDSTWKQTKWSWRQWSHSVFVVWNYHTSPWHYPKDILVKNHTIIVP